MDSEALRTFLAVHRQGGVSAAAQALSRTQSAISRRLALLEGELGLRLFERIGRGLVLSEAGAALLPHAERVAAALDDAATALAGVKTGTLGRVRLVAVGTLAGSALSAALRRVQARHPTLDLRLETATSAEVSARVRAGEASIGLRYFEDRSPDLACQVLMHERLQVVCAATHPLAGRRVRSLAQLAHQRWLAFPVVERRGEAFAATILAQFIARGIDQPDCVAIDSLTAQKRLVEAGFGLALLQAGAVDEELARGQLARVRVDDLDVSVPVVQVLRKGAWLGGAAQAVLQALQQLPAGPGAGSGRAREAPRSRAARLPSAR